MALTKLSGAREKAWYGHYALRCHLVHLFFNICHLHCACLALNEYIERVNLVYQLSINKAE